MIPIIPTTTYEGPHVEFAAIMTFLERAAHRQGWSRGPQMLYRLQQPPAEVIGEMRVIEYTAIGHALNTDLGKTPEQALGTLAAMFESPLAILALGMMDPEDSEPPNAHVFIGEAWHNEDIEDITAFRAGGGDPNKIADLPRTVMARYCIGVLDGDAILTAYRRQDTDELRWIPSEIVLQAVNDQNAELTRNLMRLHKAHVAACNRLRGETSNDRN